MKKILCAPMALALALTACGGSRQEADAPSPLIGVDQCGYRPADGKMALLLTAGKKFSVVSEADGSVAFDGQVGEARFWPEAGDSVRQMEFSALREVGAYRIVVDDTLASAPFVISDTVYASALRSAVKAFYYNRASMPIEARYGGKWARPAGHPDTLVLIHSSAVSAERPEGTAISSSRGWYDAGDYNKYIVNSSISTYSLMLAAKLWPTATDALRVGIPESGSGIPDLVSETLYNLRWMLTMQDPADGGVYHKLTTLSFEGFIMPADCHKQRYVVAKGTAAALDLAATASFASRLLPGVSPSLQSLADSCKSVALKAYNWAKANPDVTFRNPADVSTGEYGDDNLSDEWLWAATEMWLTFGGDDYAADARAHTVACQVPSWGGVSALAYYSMVAEGRNVPGFDASAAISSSADSLLRREAESPVCLSLEKFDWGSNSSVANEAMLKLVAAKAAPDNAAALRASVLNDVHYLFGRNGVGYSFVTGVGSRSPMHIHHRPSAADGIDEPVPGFLAGGPNTVVPTDCGDEPTRSQYPAKAYADQECSYSTNEIAINWNAPLVFDLLGLWGN